MHYNKKEILSIYHTKAYGVYQITFSLKIQLTPELDVDGILAAMAKHYAKEEVSTIDGVKVDFQEEWVHLRKSNTEPIIRIYTESNSQENADALAQKVMKEIAEIAQL